MGNKPWFHRALKMRHIFAAAIGGTISSAYFNGDIISQVGPFTFIAFAAGGLITWLTMSCMAELAGNETPNHLSFINYAKKHISPSWACGVGWTYWANWILFIPSECISGGILMQRFLPCIPVYVWATLFGLIITWVNLAPVRIFGKASFWLTFTHISLFLGFCVFAILIYFGFIGPDIGEVMSANYLLGSGVFPRGFEIFLINMVVIMLNFQGPEILGLCASESTRPYHDVPHSMKEMGFTVSALYVIPILLLALIFPWQDTANSENIFADALSKYGFTGVANAFTVLVIVGVLSCINSGMYACSRSMQALAELKMAPSFLAKVDEKGVPHTAMLSTVFIIWLVFLVAYFFPSRNVYAYLITLSGFMGGITWISICFSQLRYRRALSRVKQETLNYRIHAFPFLTHCAIWIQVAAMSFIALSKELRPSFYTGTIALIVPILLYKCKKKVGNSE